jgi:N-ethylmaleimide reductase
MTEKTLFQPYVLGDLVLANRVVMGPLTRNRAGSGLVPNELRPPTTHSVLRLA